MCASVVTHPYTRAANASAAREVTIGPLGLAGTLHLPASAKRACRVRPWQRLQPI